MKISKTIAAVIAIAFLCMITCKETTTEPTITESEKLLLTENELPANWKYDPNHTKPEGVVPTQYTLYQIIDGGDGVFLDRGFISGAFKCYWDQSTDTTTIIYLEIYEQKNSDSALSVFKELYPSSSEVVSIGDTAVFSNDALFNLELYIKANNFYIQLTAYETKEQVYKDALISFGQKIVTKIGKE